MSVSFMSVRCMSVVCMSGLYVCLVCIYWYFQFSQVRHKKDYNSDI